LRAVLVAEETYKRVLQSCSDYDGRWIVPEIKRNNLWLKAFYHPQRLARLVFDILIAAEHDNKTGCMVFKTPRKQWAFEGSREYAYRIVAFSVRGWPPRSGRAEIVRHVCGNKHCVHPEHLSVGSPRENKLDEVKAQAGALGASDATAKVSVGSQPRSMVKKRNVTQREIVPAPLLRTPSGRKPQRRS